MDPDEATTDPETTLLASKWCFMAAGWPSSCLAPRWNCLGAGFHCRHTALNSAPGGKTPILRSGWPAIPVFQWPGLPWGAKGVKIDQNLEIFDFLRMPPGHHNGPR